jgi:threonylcarbamoyladenosine tRNA methylthiotransferase MtaB
MKVYLDMVGCRLNQAEIEQMARQFRSEGHTIIATPAGADMVVINTCSVTSEAAADSRQKIRRAAKAGSGEIIATGCWSTLQPGQAAELPRVTRVVPNTDKDTLVADVLDLPREHFDNEPLAREILPGLRHRTRAFIKTQDGCDNQCTFCITTIARGKSRSRSADNVISDIRAALEGGTQEIVLTGVHLGAWGLDFNLRLRNLVKQILDETDVQRLRLSSLEPWDLDADFFSLWTDARLMPHLHLPLQSGSSATLKRMLRKTSPESFRDLVSLARSVIPDGAITTDVIAGFPGETEAEFAETLAFVKNIRFAGGHVFTYSARPGTSAARMKEQIPHDIRKERNARLRAAFTELSADYHQQFVGCSLPVLWESTSQVSDSGWQMEGWTGNYIRVRALAPELRWNRVDMVKLSGLVDDGMTGELITC